MASLDILPLHLAQKLSMFFCVVSFGISTGDAGGVLMCAQPLRMAAGCRVSMVLHASGSMPFPMRCSASSVPARTPFQKPLRTTNLLKPAARLIGVCVGAVLALSNLSKTDAVSSLVGATSVAGHRAPQAAGAGATDEAVSASSEARGAVSSTNGTTSWTVVALGNSGVPPSKATIIWCSATFMSSSSMVSSSR